VTLGARPEGMKTENRPWFAATTVNQNWRLHLSLTEITQRQLRVWLVISETT